MAADQRDRLGRVWLVALAAAALITLILTVSAASPASASAARSLTVSSTTSITHPVLSFGPAHKPRYWALKWAESRAGCWYSWGGSSCAPGFDCSGLVMAAYAHMGIALPHSTYSMLASWHLYWIPAYKRQQGDLAFYGTGHVELVTQGGTFGALDPGTQVYWHQPSAWWHPTAYYRVRW
jgi:cell wall-associated NlpC family hydrolase